MHVTSLNGRNFSRGWELSRGSWVLTIIATEVKLQWLTMRWILICSASVLFVCLNSRRLVGRPVCFLAYLVSFWGGQLTKMKWCWRFELCDLIGQNLALMDVGLNIDSANTIVGLLANVTPKVHISTFCHSSPRKASHGAAVVHAASRPVKRHGLNKSHKMSISQFVWACLHWFFPPSYYRANRKKNE